MDMRIFGERLREIRLLRNLSVEELAEETHLNKTTIYRYEKGEFNSIKTSKLETIAKCLYVSKDYLTGDSDDKFSTTSLKELSKKENIEINNVIYFTKEIIKQKNVTLDGKPINEVNIDYIIDTLELALEMLKRKNGGN